MSKAQEVIKGRIVGFDEKKNELLIRAPYDNIHLLTKREYKTCLVQPIDSRPLSDKQRRMCYALLREIADYTGQGDDMTKEYMKLKFLVEDIEQTHDQIFSLSNAPMSIITAFQRYLIRFILEWGIPCRFSLLEYVDDVSDYIYSCLINKKCCICGKKADLHHHDRVQSGRNRDVIDHLGMLVLPLCRAHHTEAHSMPLDEFNQKYCITPVPVDATLKKIWRLKGERKRYDGSSNWTKYSN